MKQKSIFLAFGILSAVVLFVVFTFGRIPAFFWVSELMIFTIIVGAFLILTYVFQQDRRRLKRMADLLPKKQGVVLKHLIEHHNLSKVDLETRTGWSEKKLSKVLDELEAENVIVEEDERVYLVMDL